MTDEAQTSGPPPQQGSGEKLWGAVDAHGAEIWDTKPTFTGDTVTWRDWFKLLFYPKKFLLYRAITKHIKKQKKFLPLRGGARGGQISHGPLPTSPARGGDQRLRILDVGCGTGASVIDLKKLFGRDVEVCGIDVVQLQIELATKKIKEHGVHANVTWYDGTNIPFPHDHFDAVYTSDVLGHVEDVSAWLDDLYAVLKPGGILAMFSESKLGRHAYIRRHMFDHGLNIDPHDEFHISLYSKKQLREKITNAGFSIKTMLAGMWAYFFFYPEEVAPKLQAQKKFFFLRLINRPLSWLKKKTHPYSTALVELYALAEMVTIGRKIESQGYIIIAHKND